jgi:hypothetical protein
MVGNRVVHIAHIAMIACITLSHVYRVCMCVNNSTVGILPENVTTSGGNLFLCKAFYVYKTTLRRHGVCHAFTLYLFVFLFGAVHAFLLSQERCHVSIMTIITYTVNTYTTITTVHVIPGVQCNVQDYTWSLTAPPGRTLKVI